MTVRQLLRGILTITLAVGFVIAQTGNGITIERSTSLPGAISAAPSLILTSSVGQPSAGTMNGPGFSLAGGFIVPDLVPTAAAVTVSGRVLDPTGSRGAASAVALLTDQLGVVHRSIASTFGYFKFDGIESGRSYVLSVTHRQFEFEPQTLLINDTVEGLILVAESRAPNR